MCNVTDESLFTNDPPVSVTVKLMNFFTNKNEFGEVVYLIY